MEREREREGELEGWRGWKSRICVREREREACTTAVLNTQDRKQTASNSILRRGGGCRVCEREREESEGAREWRGREGD